MRKCPINTPQHDKVLDLGISINYTCNDIFYFSHNLSRVLVIVEHIIRHEMDFR